MSDFLTRLVARSVGSAEVVRPRLPSLYEPPRPGLATPAEWEPASQWAAEAPSAETGFEIASEIGPAIDVATNDRVALVNPNPQKSDSGFKQASSKGARQGQHHLATVPIAGPVTLEEPALEKTSAALRHSLSSPRLSKPQVPQPSIVGHNETRLPPADARSLPKPAIQPDVGAASDNGFGSAECPSIGSLDEAIAQPFGRQDRSSPLRSRVVQPGAARRLRPEAFQLPTRVQNAEPTIQVTIGRVEVRAVPEQAGRARKERSPSPVMGLDEYLRRRVKGGTQ
jgi:hypothetical protein